MEDHLHLAAKPTWLALCQDEKSFLSSLNWSMRSHPEQDRNIQDFSARSVISWVTQLDTRERRGELVCGYPLDGMEQIGYLR